METELHYKLMLLLSFIEISSNSSSDDNNGVNIALATLLAISVIGLVISIVINVFFVVQHKQSRCVVVTSTYILYVAIVDYLL